MKKAQTQNRNRRNGRFSFDGNWDRLCVCGRTFGVHDAEWPHPFGDLALDRRELPECEAFRPADKGRAALKGGAR